LTKTLIDKLHPQVRQSFGHKPQTYRKQARKQFLAVAKKKRLRIDKIRKTISSESRSIPDRIVSLYQAPYNEGEDLKVQARAYRRRHGYYPKVICADQIYRTRSNRAFC